MHIPHYYEFQKNCAALLCVIAAQALILWAAMVGGYSLTVELILFALVYALSNFWGDIHWAQLFIVRMGFPMPSV